MNNKCVYIVVLWILVVACQTNPTGNLGSHMLSFGYLGRCDTNVATLKGNIKTIINRAENELANVNISLGSIQTISDTLGNFILTLPKGNYSVIFHKNGYRDIKLNNFNAENHQISKVVIILNKGNGVEEYDIAKGEIGNDTRNK